MCPAMQGLTREDAAALAAKRPDFKLGEHLFLLYKPASIFLLLPELCLRLIRLHHKLCPPYIASYGFSP